MKLNCPKCSGFAQGGALFVDDGVDCPICSRKETEGKVLGEEDSGGQTREEESGGRR